MAGKKESRPKKKYQPPELREYGSIRDLTAGGSGGGRENKPHPGPNRRA